MQSYQIAIRWLVRLLLVGCVVFFGYYTLSGNRLLAKAIQLERDGKTDLANFTHAAAVLKYPYSPLASFSRHSVRTQTSDGKPAMLPEWDPAKPRPLLYPRWDPYKIEQMPLFLLAFCLLLAIHYIDPMDVRTRRKSAASKVLIAVVVLSAMGVYWLWANAAEGRPVPGFTRGVFDMLDYQSGKNSNSLIRLGGLMYVASILLTGWMLLLGLTGQKRIDTGPIKASQPESDPTGATQ